MRDAPAAGPAKVASRLLAFYRAPAVWRARYLDGSEPLPDGATVLRFAQARLPDPWHRALPEPEREELRAAALAFVRQVCLSERASHYQALCVRGDADAAALTEAYRLMMALIHPDRRDEGAAPWPTGCAQRVNLAYATLSEPRRRAPYDDGLARMRGAARSAAFAPAPARSRAVRPKAGLLKRATMVGGMVLALFALQAWWFTPAHDSMLERAFFLDATKRWMRDAIAAAELPRFLAGEPAAARPFDPLLEPLERPMVVASLGAARALSQAPVLMVAVEQPASTGAPPRAVPAARPPTEALAPAAARAVQVPPPQPPILRTAQLAATQAESRPREAAGPTSEDVELMVALLVSFYEAGDVDRLMGLFAQDALGAWGALRTRAAFGDFFRATRERRLRVSLGWDIARGEAQARGNATVSALDEENGKRLELQSPVLIDVALRDGQPRVTRLSLYPDLQ